jgi:hypothetical protein
MLNSDGKSFLESNYLENLGVRGWRLLKCSKGNYLKGSKLDSPESSLNSWSEISLVHQLWQVMC